VNTLNQTQFRTDQLKRRRAITQLKCTWLSPQFFSINSHNVFTPLAAVITSADPQGDEKCVALWSELQSVVQQVYRETHNARNDTFSIDYNKTRSLVKELCARNGDYLAKMLAKEACNYMKQLQMQFIEVINCLPDS
jgi:hypothetical protein